MAKSNIAGELIFPDKNYTKYIPEVTETTPVDINGAINPGSLFDPEIFGVPGSDERMRNIGCINLHAELLHPMIAVYLDEVSTLFTSVIEGTVKVKFEKGELIPHPTGETGYTFFLSILDKLNLPEKKSSTREQGRQVILQYRKQGRLTNNYLLVIAAGLRELIIEDGRVTSDEVNDIYTRIMNSASIVRSLPTDNTYLHLHNLLKELYKHFLSLISGKKKAMNAHLARNYSYGSRNVITGQVLKYKTIDDIPDDIVDRFTIGLNQYLKNIEPVVIYHVNKVFLDNTINIDRIFKDGKSVPHMYSSNAHKQFNKDTITKLIEEMQITSFRHTEVLLDGYPIGYVDVTESEIKVYLPNSTDDMGNYLTPPPTAHPMTHGEMFYIAIGDVVAKYGIMSTRYPIADENSSVVGKVILETTIRKSQTKPKHLTVLTNNIKEYDTDIFPVLGDDWHESFVIPYFRLSGFGADFDGDGMASGNPMTEEANENIDEVLNGIAYYKPFDLDISDKPADFTMLTLTRD